MTNEQRKANNYLLEIRNANKEVTEMILKIDYLRYKASGAGAIRYDKDHVQTSPEDMVCEAIAEAVTIENKLFAKHKRLSEMRTHTEQVIGMWNDDKNARFIDIYYLKHGSMVDAARQIGCSDRNVYFIRKKALEEFSKHIQ